MAKKAEKVTAPVRPGPGNRPLQTLIPDGQDFLPESRFLPGLSGKRLNGLDLSEHLFGPGNGPRQAILNPGTQPPNPLSKQPPHDGRERNGNHGHQCQVGMRDGDEDQGADQKHALAYQFGNSKPQDPLDQSRVGGDTGRQLPDAPGVEKSWGLVDESAEEILPKVGHYPLGSGRREITLAEVDDGLECKQPN